MKSLSILLITCLPIFAQPWSTFLDPTRAIDWTSAGFTIPNYTVNCTTQPTLLTGAGNAATNATRIRNALLSCDATHNVVNIAAGTYSVAGLQMGSQGNQVIRGAGPTLTKIISTSEGGCSITSAGICEISANPSYNQSAEVLPPSGTQQCLWSGTNGSVGTYTQGATTINLTNCGGTPPLNKLIIMDQADDSTDTGGVYICNSVATNCVYDGAGSYQGRLISGKYHDQVQVTYVTAVTSLGGGAYTLTISPGVYFTNVRTGNGAGIWWSDFVQNAGVENLTVDGTADGDYTVGFYDCYHCWIKNVTLLNGGRASATMYQSAFDVIRDSYFYQAQGHQQISYNIESQQSSGFLIENNIFQQTTSPVTFNTATGAVVDYNFAIDNIAFTGYTWGAFSSHNAGSEMNLWEGNNITLIEADDAWGASTQQTYFRNMLTGWSHGNTMSTTPIILKTFDRAWSVIGNVMGQPSYHTQYQTYATSNSGGIGGASEDTSIYSLGWAFPGGVCGSGANNTSPSCDAKVFSTLMRWGNYDTITAGVKWDSTEASPVAVTYLNANFTSGYFGSLAHTLPSSLYYNSTPSWWPSGQTWPAVGPDIVSGNLGICSGGTYTGSQATASSQCTGGSLVTAYAGHANTIPAQNCYLNILHGTPDGTGSALAFDAGVCYTNTPTTPSITTTSATSITSSTASSGGTVTNNGGASITSEGVCYAITVTPTVPCTSDGTSTPFTSSLTGLAAGTLYHYRAFATNSVGIGYGSDLTFTTAGSIPPGGGTGSSKISIGGSIIFQLKDIFKCDLLSFSSVCPVHWF